MVKFVSILFYIVVFYRANVNAIDNAKIGNAVVIVNFSCLSKWLSCVWCTAGSFAVEAS